MAGIVGSSNYQVDVTLLVPWFWETPEVASLVDLNALQQLSGPEVESCELLGDVQGACCGVVMARRLRAVPREELLEDRLGVVIKQVPAC